MSTAGVPVLFHRLALAEYLQARRWYAHRSVSVAQTFQDAVDDAVRLLEANPTLGAPYGSRFRWVRVQRFPYILYYEDLSPLRITVFAVAHARRRPGYWRSRT